MARELDRKKAYKVAKVVVITISLLALTYSISNFPKYNRLKGKCTVRGNGESLCTRSGYLKMLTGIKIRNGLIVAVGLPIAFFGAVATVNYVAPERENNG